MDRRRWAILGGVVLLVAGCERPPRADQETPPTAPAPGAMLPEVTAEREQDMADLVFRVQEHRRQPDGSQRIRAAGLHRGREVGFEVVLGATWAMGKAEKDVPFRISRGTVSYRRVGPQSDAFLQALDEVYGVKLSPKSMAAETSFAAAALQGDPQDLTRGPVRIKLFYEGDAEDRYAELITNIDLAAGRLEVREKDEDYRRAVVRALQGD